MAPFRSITHPGLLAASAMSASSEPSNGSTSVLATANALALRLPPDAAAFTFVGGLPVGRLSRTSGRVGSEASGTVRAPGAGAGSVAGGSGPESKVSALSLHLTSTECLGGASTSSFENSSATPLARPAPGCCIIACTCGGARGQASELALARLFASQTGGLGARARRGCAAQDPVQSTHAQHSASRTECSCSRAAGLRRVLCNSAAAQPARQRRPPSKRASSAVGVLSHRGIGSGDAPNRAQTSGSGRNAGGRARGRLASGGALYELNFLERASQRGSKRAAYQTLQRAEPARLRTGATRRAWGRGTGAGGMRRAQARARWLPDPADLSAHLLRG